MRDLDKFGKLSDRDILIGLAKDMDTVKDGYRRLCKTVYNEHPKEHKALDKRVHDIEIKDAKGEGSEEKSKDNGALAVAIISLLIAGLSLVTAIVSTAGG